MLLFILMATPTTFFTEFGGIEIDNGQFVLPQERCCDSMSAQAVLSSILSILFYFDVDVDVVSSIFYYLI